MIFEELLFGLGLGRAKDAHRVRVNERSVKKKIIFEELMFKVAAWL